MGQKGDKLSEAASQQVEALLDDLMPLGDVTVKSMFGGYGVFESGTMFAMVDSAGMVLLRATETAAAFVDAGSEKHSRMPYWTVPQEVLDDSSTLEEWAGIALTEARMTKKK